MAIEISRDGSDKIQLAARNIIHRFGSFEALKDVSIDIRQGEFLTLLGPSGSGKTTFLNVLAGFIQPNEGALLMDGRDVTSIPAEHRNFGMVFQGYALFPHMTVARNVAFPLRVRGVSASEQKERVRSVLQRVGLETHSEKFPRQLSGGQQQRVALARALVFSPDILLLDEPLSALDKKLREQLQVELQRIHREFATTFVFVTHDQTEALGMSDRVAIFDGGRLIQIGTPADVYRRPNSRFVAEFLGQMNLLPLQNAASSDGWVAGHYGTQVLRSPGAITGDVMLGVRPEHMALSDTEPETQRNAISVTVSSVAFHGASIHLILKSSEPERSFSIFLPAESWDRSDFDDRQRWLSWIPENGMVFQAETKPV